MVIREIEIFDIDSAVNLLNQLGYHAEKQMIQRRLSHLKSPTNLILVAESSRKVIGLMHLQVRATLLDDLQAEIVSLVVDEAWRGKGVGKRLLAAADEWALAKGFSKIQLYSNQKRTSAHAFYIQNGYQKIKDSIMLVKKVNKDPAGERLWVQEG